MVKRQKMSEADQQLADGEALAKSSNEDDESTRSVEVNELQRPTKAAKITVRFATDNDAGVMHAQAQNTGTVCAFSEIIHAQTQREENPEPKLETNGSESKFNLPSIHTIPKTATTDSISEHESPKVGPSQSDTSDRQQTSSKKRKQNFLDKLAELLEDETTWKYISWNREGDVVVIKDIQGFTIKTLSKFFSHQNFNSFIRQLNMYGFRKQISSANMATYQNPLFRRGNADLRRKIVRSTTKALRQADKKVEKCKEEIYHTFDTLEQVDHELLAATKYQQDMIQMSANIQKHANEIQRKNLEVWQSIATIRNESAPKKAQGSKTFHIKQVPEYKLGQIVEQHRKTSLRNSIVNNSQRSQRKPESHKKTKPATGGKIPDH